MSDRSLELQQRVQTAVTDKTMLRIVGGDSKTFYGNTTRGEPLETRIHHGITSYEPTELVISARAGTPLKEIEAALAEHNQMLPFEPPHFGEHATLGGAIATGLSGPRRPFTGSARDFVLGMRILNGKGEILEFGGQVMKNVAGYDVSRLMTGALGTLGVILDVSIKVLPKPAIELTLCQNCSQQDALQHLKQLMQLPVPITAAAHLDNQLYVRLGGAISAVEAAAKQVGGVKVMQDQHLWMQLREQQHAFFKQAGSLWRISLPHQSSFSSEENQFLDWAGAQRWLFSERSTDEIRHQAKQAGGHAVLFRSDNNHAERFEQLPSKLRQWHLNLKETFDPYGLLNYGRFYADL